MAAEVDLGGGGEPAQVVGAVVAPPEERGLGEVQLAGDVAHPALVARRGQRAPRRWVAGEGPVRERVDLDDPLCHARLPSSKIRRGNVWSGPARCAPAG